MTMGHVGLPTIEYRVTEGADEFLAVIVDMLEVPKEHPPLLLPKQLSTTYLSWWTTTLRSTEVERCTRKLIFKKL